MTRSSLLILFILWLAQGCGPNKNFELTIEFPEIALGCKDLITTLNIYSISPTADDVTCENLNNGTQKPGDEGYSSDDQITLSRPFSEIPRTLKTKKNTTPKLFFISALNANNDVILRGCQEVLPGESSTSVTVPLGMATYCISGMVSGDTKAGVTITLSSSASFTSTTDESGNYTFIGFGNGEYTVTPTKSGYSFSPIDQKVIVSDSNIIVQEFIASICSEGWCLQGPLPQQISLYGVWGSGANDVWAVGLGGILHWDGQVWSTAYSSPNTEIRGIWGSGPYDVWAVQDTATILNWNGVEWSTVSQTITTKRLESFWGMDVNNIWVVGEGGKILYRNGNTWNNWSFSTQTPTYYDLWGTDIDHIWFVGDSIVLGAELSRISCFSDTSSTLYGVWGSGINDIWAVGDNGTILHGVNQDFRNEYHSGTTYQLHDIWGSGANDVWVVGDGGTIVHWNGTAWLKVNSGTTKSLYGVWGSGANDVWAVGDNIILRMQK